MSGPLAQALHDLMGTEGVQGAFVYGSGGFGAFGGTAKIRDVEAVARGLSSALRTLGAEVHRLELRCERGRLLVRPLAGGAILAVVVAPHVTTASLSFALAAAAAAAAQEAGSTIGPAPGRREGSSGAAPAAAPPPAPPTPERPAR